MEDCGGAGPALVRRSRRPAIERQPSRYNVMPSSNLRYGAIGKPAGRHVAALQFKHYGFLTGGVWQDTIVVSPSEERVVQPTAGASENEYWRVARSEAPARGAATNPWDTCAAYRKRNEPRPDRAAVAPGAEMSAKRIIF
jgi:hypothetical protein